MTTEQAKDCQGRACFDQPKTEARNHDSNHRNVLLCDLCAGQLGHEGEDCWCTEWRIRWGDVQNTEGGFELQMEASKATTFADTKIWFSIRAWQEFCFAGSIRELDAASLARVVSTWGQEQVVRYIKRFERGEMTHGFSLSPKYKLTITDGSTFHVDRDKAGVWLRKWGLL